MPEHPAEEIVHRIMSEFLEMPGLRLTGPQACRLWALNVADCSAALEKLIATGFLLRARNGSFMRVEPASLLNVERLRPSNASVKSPAA